MSPTDSKDNSGIGIKKWLTGPGPRDNRFERKKGQLLGDTRRIAVLPFANMSPDPNDSYFADGITEEIISTLSGVSGLSVISRTSVMGYRGTTKKVREIGDELDAGSILEGSIRKAGNRIRVTTQLIAVNNDQHVWAQSYDRNLDDVFAVQTDIAKQVVDALRVRMLAQEVGRIERKPTTNTEAYSLYLKGRYHWNRRHPDEIKKAIAYFEEVIEKDQEFAAGYVGLADSRLILANNFNLDTFNNLEKAQSALSKALELDPDLAEAHASQGLAFLINFRFKESERAFRRAIELKPNYASAHQWYFHLLSAELRWDEALKEIEKAVELDPISPVINNNLALYYLMRRDYPKAAELAKKGAELDPNSIDSHIELFHASGMMGKLDDMRRESQILAGLLGKIFPYDLRVLEAETALFEGRKEIVEKLLPEFEAHLGESPGAGASNIAGLYFYLGNKNKGFEYLEKAYSRREQMVPWMRVHSYFDNARSDPRYLHLLKKLGLEARASA